MRKNNRPTRVGRETIHPPTKSFASNLRRICATAVAGVMAFGMFGVAFAADEDAGTDQPSEPQQTIQITASIEEVKSPDDLPEPLVIEKDPVITETVHEPQEISPDEGNARIPSDATTTTETTTTQNPDGTTTNTTTTDTSYGSSQETSSPEIKDQTTSGIEVPKPPVTFKDDEKTTGTVSDEDMKDLKELPDGELSKTETTTSKTDTNTTVSGEQHESTSTTTDAEGNVVGDSHDVNGSETTKSETTTTTTKDTVTVEKETTESVTNERGESLSGESLELPSGNATEPELEDTISMLTQPEYVGWTLYNDNDNSLIAIAKVEAGGILNLQASGLRIALGEDGSIAVIRDGKKSAPSEDELDAIKNALNIWEEQKTTTDESEQKWSMKGSLWKGEPQNGTLPALRPSDEKTYEYLKDIEEFECNGDKYTVTPNSDGSLTVKDDSGNTVDDLVSVLWKKEDTDRWTLNELTAKKTQTIDLGTVGDISATPENNNWLTDKVLNQLFKGLAGYQICDGDGNVIATIQEKEDKTGVQLSYQDEYNRESLLKVLKNDNSDNWGSFSFEVVKDSEDLDITSDPEKNGIIFGDAAHYTIGSALPDAVDWSKDWTYTVKDQGGQRIEMYVHEGTGQLVEKSLWTEVYNLLSYKGKRSSTIKRTVTLKSGEEKKLKVESWTTIDPDPMEAPSTPDFDKALEGFLSTGWTEKTIEDENGTSHTYYTKGNCPEEVDQASASSMSSWLSNLEQYGYWGTDTSLRNLESLLSDLSEEQQKEWNALSPDEAKTKAREITNAAIEYILALGTTQTSFQEGTLSQALFKGLLDKMTGSDTESSAPSIKPWSEAEIDSVTIESSKKLSSEEYTELVTDTLTATDGISKLIGTELADKKDQSVPVYHAQFKVAIQNPGNNLEGNLTVVVLQQDANGKYIPIHTQTFSQDELSALTETSKEGAEVATLVLDEIAVLGNKDRKIRIELKGVQQEEQAKLSLVKPTEKNFYSLANGDTSTGAETSNVAFGWTPGSLSGFVFGAQEISVVEKPSAEASAVDSIVWKINGTVEVSKANTQRQQEIKQVHKEEIKITTTWTQEKTSVKHTDIETVFWNEHRQQDVQPKTPDNPPPNTPDNPLTPPERTELITRQPFYDSAPDLPVPEGPTEETLAAEPEWPEERTLLLTQQSFFEEPTEETLAAEPEWPEPENPPTSVIPGVPDEPDVTPVTPKPQAPEFTTTVFEPRPNRTTPEVVHTSKSVPKTGDDTFMGIWTIAASAALFAIWIALRSLRRTRPRSSTGSR